jgi:cytochrome c oxidase subunit 2
MVTMVKVTQTVLLLGVLSLAPQSAVAQEEHHEHGHHEHPKYAKLKNPVAMTEASVAEGKKMYEKHCIACHGAGGKGGIGPAFTGSLRIHGNTDGEMFHVLTDGVAGTAMQGFKKELPEKNRWNLVNYLKSLRTKDDTN